MIKRLGVVFLSAAVIAGCFTRATYYQLVDSRVQSGECYGPTGKGFELNREVFVRVSAIPEVGKNTTDVSIYLDIPADTEVRFLEHYVIFLIGSSRRETIKLSGTTSDYVYEGPARTYTDKVVTGKYRITATTSELLDSFMLRLPRLDINGVKTQIPDLAFVLKRNDLVPFCGEIGPGP